jgi:hypothetical protein
MKKYLITITMPDGSSAKAWGLFASAWHAIDAYMGAFPGAASVTPRRLS